MSNLCLIVPAQVAQKIKKILKGLELWDGNRRLLTIPGAQNVAIPITSNQHDLLQLAALIKEKISLPEEMAEIMQIKEMSLPLAKKLLITPPERMLKETIEKLFKDKDVKLTDELRKEVPDHWEKHGDLILLADKAFYSSDWKIFGCELWEKVCISLQCRRLARKTVISQNGFRSPQVTLLYGEDGWVEHVDNGIRYTYDVTKCMFSSGNITEKLRVAKLDCTGETVVDLYAGIGYFTLPYLMYTGVKHLHACEWNPDAVEALQRNLQLNGVEERCTVHFGDNRKVCPKNIADRVNLGLIPSSEPGWMVACAALKSDTGGILHIHANVNTKQDPRSEQSDRYIDHTAAKESNVKQTDNAMIVTNVVDSDQTGETTEQKSVAAAGNSGLDRTEMEYSALTASNYTELHGDTANVELITDNSKHTLLKPKQEDAIIAEKDSEKVSSSEINTRDKLQTKVANLKWLVWTQEVSLSIECLLREAHGGEWQTEVLHIEHVKSYAPHVDHVVLDLKCRPSHQ